MTSRACAARRSCSSSIPLPTRPAGRTHRAASGWVPLGALLPHRREPLLRLVVPRRVGELPLLLVELTVGVVHLRLVRPVLRVEPLLPLRLDLGIDLVLGCTHTGAVPARDRDMRA